MKYPLMTQKYNMHNNNTQKASSSSFNDVLILKVRSSNSDAFQNEGAKQNFYLTVI